MQYDIRSESIRGILDVAAGHMGLFTAADAAAAGLAKTLVSYHARPGGR